MGLGLEAACLDLCCRAGGKARTPIARPPLTHLELPAPLGLRLTPLPRLRLPPRRLLRRLLRHLVRSLAPQL